MICQVNMTVQGRHGPAEIWFPFETDEAEDIRELRDLLEDGAMVCGTRYEVRPLDPGRKEVVKRFDFAISGEHAIASISGLTFEMVGD